MIRTLRSWCFSRCLASNSVSRADLLYVLWLQQRSSNSFLSRMSIPPAVVEFGLASTGSPFCWAQGKATPIDRFGRQGISNRLFCNPISPWFHPHGFIPMLSSPLIQDRYHHEANQPSDHQDSTNNNQGGIGLRGIGCQPVLVRIRESLCFFLGRLIPGLS